MAFLIPSYTRADFVRVEHRDGVEIFERIDFTDEKIREMFDTEGHPCVIETIAGKWWGRLSAPGYLDCTEWSGPHDTLDEARASLREAYDVNPDTGEDLPACSQKTFTITITVEGPEGDTFDAFEERLNQLLGAGTIQATIMEDLDGDFEIVSAGAA